jgi:hypothetical protein
MADHTMAGLGSDRLRTLYRYWREKCGGRRMPARADIEPLEIPELLPTLLLIDIVMPESGAAGPRFRVRLAGTEIVERYGEDYTGRYLDEIDFGDQQPQILADFSECAATGAPHRGQRQFWSARGIQLQMERLILPLGADGETADMLLAGLHFEPLKFDL